MPKGNISINRRPSSIRGVNEKSDPMDVRLLTLKLVISKLADLASKRNVSHIPYRDSKL